MKIAMVATQGGHLTELLQLVDAFDGHDFFFVTHHSSRNFDVEQISRSYFSEGIVANPFRMVRAFFESLRVLRIEKPDLIITTGAEIAVPYIILGKILTIRTIYIESWCRIETKSYTGRIAYPLVDIFLVQWPQMLDVYGKKAKFWGAVI